MIELEVNEKFLEKARKYFHKTPGSYVSDEEIKEFYFAVIKTAVKNPEHKVIE